MALLFKFIFLVFLSKGIQAELKLVSAVFRHGDRAPDNNAAETYPTDPYLNNTYFPIGQGGLLNIGKIREYRLGQFLRKTYDKFLGPFYYKGVVSARSTYIDRTRQSLQLVLAGLYPSKGNQTWNKQLSWQPIPTRFVPHLDDVMMYNYDCPNVIEALKKATDTDEYKKELNEFVPLMKNLSDATGKPFKTSIDMNFLYHGLVNVQNLNLELPQWTEGIYPRGKLYDGALLSYKLYGYSETLRRLYGGFMLRRITDDMTDACEGKANEPKIFLWSGHEFNVATLMQALNIYEPHIPRFSSAMIFELHKENNECIVKLKYYRGLVRSDEKDHSMVQEPKVPGVKSNTLKEFKDVLKKHIATDDDIKGCNKRSMPEFIKAHKDLAGPESNSIIRLVEQERQNKPKLE